MTNGFIPVRLTYCADYGCTTTNNATLGILNEIAAKNPDVNIAGGDFDYLVDPDCWFTENAALDPITKLVTIGNHDGPYTTALTRSYVIANCPDLGAPDFQSKIIAAYPSCFVPGKQYGSVDINNQIHLVNLATDYPRSSTGDEGEGAETAPNIAAQLAEQSAWLKSDLANARCKCDIRWIIVCGHKDIYLSGMRDNEILSDQANLRDTYHPIFDNYGVDMYLCGHIHDYQRSYPIRWNHTYDTPPTSTEDDVIDPNGMIHVMVGTGGINHSALSHPTELRPWLAYQDLTNFGFLIIDATYETLSCEFWSKNYISGGVWDTPTLRDSFSITKS
jgi:hypothetical protein